MACPVCSKKSTPDYRPFCCKRCADVDLAHWLRGDYSIPGAPLDDVSSDGDDGQHPDHQHIPPRRP